MNDELSMPTGILTKAQLTLLGKVFEAEIEGRLLQSKAKGYAALEKDGLVQRSTRSLGRDRFGLIEVSGWELTHAGRFMYCHEASERVCPEFENMGEHACENRHQCFEPCGELGKSEKHVRVYKSKEPHND